MAATPAPAQVAVVVPTYRRAADLSRCLAALARQTAAPAQVLVVVRRGDDESEACCREAELPVHVVHVDRPGQVAALNAGLARAEADIVAFTDDDCEPHPDWVERIATHFASDLRVGAVGGRDVVRVDGVLHDLEAERVGRISWFGRSRGNHHGEAPKQDVDYLKGANMAYRRTLLDGFDERLRGNGAQVHNDLRASLQVSAGGHRVIWDPAVRVDHNVAPRPTEDRVQRTSTEIRDQHHNELYTLARTLGPRRAVPAIAYRFLVGTRTGPGLVHLVLALVRGGEPRRTLDLYRDVTAGRVLGLASAARAK